MKIQEILLLLGIGSVALATPAQQNIPRGTIIPVSLNSSLSSQNAKPGASYCPHLANLKKNGINYLDTSTSRPSDSFPGLMSIVSGGTPRTMGIFYDVAYDRSLAPPQNMTGNGLAGGSCTPGVFNGTSTEYEEGIDINQNLLNGGGLGDGDVSSIDPTRLPRDPANNCEPVYPWNFVRTNTIFGVIHQAGGYTAWSDKHPAYSSVSGPNTSGPANVPQNLDDFLWPRNQFHSCIPAGHSALQPDRGSEFLNGP